MNHDENLNPMDEAVENNNDTADEMIEKGNSQEEEIQENTNQEEDIFFEEDAVKVEAEDAANNTYYSSYSASPNPTKNNNKKTNVGLIIVIAIVSVIVIGAVFVFTSYKVLTGVTGQSNKVITDIFEDNDDEKDYKDIGSTDTSKNDNNTSSSVKVTDVSGVVTNAMPSVVAITSTTLVESNYYGDDFFDYYFGGGNQDKKKSYEEQAAGSGIILDQTDSELLIVTNNHVVAGADKLSIQFYGQSGDEGVVGYLKGTDPNVDVAVVAVKLKDIDSKILKNIKKATIGDSDSLKVGEGVIAIGNALGYGQSVTTGIISAKDRSVTIDEKTMTLLQTDAAINGGNSGGALLNASGQVIGINVAKYSSSGTTTSASVEGMGFAIPITSVKGIISDLETKETRAKVDEAKQGYLGISGYDVTSDVAKQYNMPQGVYIYSVAKKGPADKAGISDTDVITKFDGQQVQSMDSLQSLLQYYKAGEKVKVTIAYRDGKNYSEKEVTVKLGNKSVLSDIETGAME